MSTSRSFEVYAIDREPKAIEFVEAGAAKCRSRLHAKVASFEDLQQLPQEVIAHRNKVRLIGHT